jgi:ABC-type multidrug transport system permease subunit
MERGHAAAATFAIVPLALRYNVRRPLRGRGLRVVSRIALLAIVPAALALVQRLAYLLQRRLAKPLHRRSQLHHLVVRLVTQFGTRIAFWALLISILAAVGVGLRVLFPDHVLSKEVEAK